MALTLEDHERRIAALEMAQSTAGDGLTRLDRKLDRLTARVDALHHVTAELIAESEQATAKLIAESEQRLTDRIGAVEQGLTDRIGTTEHRFTDRIGTTERRFTDLLNERFDAVMVALDRFTNPPKEEPTP
jgi:phage shock protein A